MHFHLPSVFFFLPLFETVASPASEGKDGSNKVLSASLFLVEAATKNGEQIHGYIFDDFFFIPSLEMPIMSKQASFCGRCPKEICTRDIITFK